MIFTDSFFSLGIRIHTSSLRLSFWV